MKFKEVRGVLLALSIVTVTPFTLPSAVIRAEAAEETAADIREEESKKTDVQEDNYVPATDEDEEISVNEVKEETEGPVETEESKETKESEETEGTEETEKAQEAGEENPSGGKETNMEDPGSPAEEEAPVPEREDVLSADETSAQDVVEINTETNPEEIDEEAAVEANESEKAEEETAAETTEGEIAAEKTEEDAELKEPSVSEESVNDAAYMTEKKEADQKTASNSSTAADGVIYYDYAEGRYIDMGDLPTTYKIPIPKGLKYVQFENYDVLSLTVDMDGTVHPYGNGGTDFYAEDGVYEVTITGWIGDNYDDYKKTYKIRVVDYMTKKYNEKVSEIAATLRGKSQTQTLKNIAEYVAYNYKYTADNCSSVELVYKGSSDCVGTAGLVVDLCEKLGIEAYGRRDLGAGGYGHTNVIAKADGKYYVVDSSFDSSEKYYEFYEEKDGLYLLYDKTQLIQYDAFDVNPVLPEGIVKIRHAYENWTKYVFAHNYAYPVESVTIPSTVTDIDPIAFERATELKNIKVSGKNKTYMDIDGVLYSKDGKTLIRFPGSRSEYTAGNKTKTIGERAFSWIGSVGRLVLPDSVVKFGKQAFYRSSGIRDVFVPASVTQIADDSFEGASFMRIIAPAGSYMERYYKKNKSKFGDGVTFITLEEYKKTTGSDPYTDTPGQGGTTNAGWKKINNKWCYYDKNGVKKTGWLTKDGNKVYVDPKTGVLVTDDFMTIDKKNYYFDADGAMHIGWLQKGDKWYYFRLTGEMHTGMLKKDGIYYYLEKSGVRHTGWLQVNGKLYYFKTNGQMLTGWLQKSGKMYYFKTNGEMLTGWLQKNGKKFYFKTNGQMLTGWLQVKGKLYYFKENGQMVTGRYKIGNKWFTFSSNGVRQ